MSFLAVFVALKTAHRAGGYAVWSWIPTICDLRRSEHHLAQLKKTVTTDFCRQKVGESDFRVRHDAGVFRPNGRHEQKRNGEKTLKPRSFGVWGGRTKKVVATSLNQRPAKCAICYAARTSIDMCYLYVHVCCAGAADPAPVPLGPSSQWQSRRGGPFLLAAAPCLGCVKSALVCGPRSVRVIAAGGGISSSLPDQLLAGCQVCWGLYETLPAEHLHATRGGRIEVHTVLRWREFGPSVRILPAGSHRGWGECANRPTKHRAQLGFPLSLCRVDYCVSIKRFSRVG